MEKISNIKRYLKRKISVTNALLVTFLITGTFSTAGTIAEAQNQINTDNKVVAGTYEGENNYNFVTTKNDTILEGDITFNIKETGNEAFLSLNGTGVTGDKVTINITPNTGVQHSRPKGVIIRGNANAEIKELISNVTLASETKNSPSNGPDSNASYGVAVGYNFGGGTSSDTSKLTVDKMTVNVTNTADTIMAKRTASRSFWGINITAEVDFGHQLSGLKVYRKDGAKAEFIANDKVDITVTDSSTAKVGDYLVGVFISGNETKAEFNGETNITLVGDGVNSAAIKIGKPFDGTITSEGPRVTVNGKLNVDTTANTLSGAVRLFGDKSKLEVTGEEESVINSGNSAIVYDTQDYITKFKTNLGINGETSRNINGNDQVVKLNNTVLKTTSNDASLIKVRAERVRDITAGEASRMSGGQLNSGEFSNNNAIFELSGDKSVAKAASDGWLIEVKGTKTISSSLTANIKDSAVIEGLTDKKFSSKLDINLENEGKWILANKGSENKATFNNLNITNGILDATNADFVLKATTNGVEENGTVTNAGKITIDNDRYTDKLLLNGNYTGNNGKLLVNTLWNETSGKNGENSESDLFEITGEVSGTTKVITVAKDKTENKIDGTVDGEEGNRSAIVVKTPKATSANAFIGTAVTENDAELELVSEIQDEHRVFFWEITKSGPDIFLIGPKANMDQAHHVFGRLNERRIQNTLFNIGKNTEKGMPWAKLYGGEFIYDNSNKTRYMDGTIGINIGVDHYFDKNKENLTGIYFGYSNSFKNVVNNRTSAYRGTVHTDMVSLGLTNTYTRDKFYADAVLQLSGLENRYVLKNGDKYNNFGVILTGSLELGSPLYFVNNKEKDEKYIVEPQAQVIYQFSANTPIAEKNISYDLGHSVKGRAGLRVGYSTAMSTTAKNGMGYALFNVWGQYTNADKVNKGEKVYTETYPTIWLEAGLGANLPVTKNVSTYFEATLEKSVYGSNKYGGKGTFGINFEK
ncbi:hypothetical protein STFE110948_05750 [Streptobacillus felis]|uniref:hypothetical protein n=1 Tax=Streptobacillus felis TaxID=1384509 RepID=UPI00082C4681|nr:hypothetical protein [Streptobacillus felis]